MPGSAGSAVRRQESLDADGRASVRSQLWSGEAVSVKLGMDTRTKNNMTTSTWLLQIMCGKRQVGQVTEARARGNLERAIPAVNTTAKTLEVPASAGTGLLQLKDMCHQQLQQLLE